MADRRAPVPRPPKLRDVVGHKPSRVEVTAFDQDGGHAPHDRFAQRQQGVKPLRVTVLAIVLEDDVTVLQHHAGIGEGVGKDRRHLR